MEIFKTGNKVILGRKFRDDEEYTSRIEKFDNGDIRILTPISKSKLVGFREGAEIKLVVFDKDKMYKLNGIVQRNIEDNTLHYTDIKPVSEINKIERRNYFRVSMSKKIKVISHSIGRKTFYADTIDISGGGMQFITDKVLNDDDELLIELNIDDEIILLNGKVINIITSQYTQKLRYCVKFVDMDFRTQDKIIKYLFKVQRERLRVQ
ncbi:type IV pilus assembly protein PilZ [Gottschalkia purinilytica]|uniref:Type IV pilus assembly protein PilZ n=1 Tax=Gottschalkia purinilytica TaxID=1503 RepID=A0A0L0W9Y4_GOTPU|nr:PilZ domain-containing protein [Gottschalkia purinilytica]KNF08252.1 type IV pilus assembly protein PilZ [Gottschalkia purinilytica]